MRDAFAADGQREVRCPSLPGNTIVRGAVLYGSQPSMIKSHKLTHTWGIKILCPFQEGVDPESRRYYRNGEYWCSGIFSLVAQRGTTVLANKPIDQAVRSLSADSVSVSIIRTLSDTVPQYVDDPGCAEVGRITLPCRRVGERIDYSFLFSEMVHVACSNESGVAEKIDIEYTGGVHQIEEGLQRM